MFRSYRLQPQTVHDQPLEFEWNPDSGELRGKSAEIVAGLCRQAVRAGWVTGHPYPTEYAISDPLRKPEEMAVVLGQSWRLEGGLEVAYPQPNDNHHDEKGDSILVLN